MTINRDGIVWMKGRGLAAIAASAAMALACGCAMTGGGEEDEEREEGASEQDVTMADVPAAVRHTIEQHLNGGKVGDIARVTDDGKVVYEVDVAGPHGETELCIAEDGTFLGANEEENGGNEREEEHEEAGERGH